MYRNGLFAAKCDLFAYRYKDMSDDSSGLSSPYAFGAADAAAIINEAKYYYATEPNIMPTDTFSKERFLRLLRKVCIAKIQIGRHMIYWPFLYMRNVIFAVRMRGCAMTLDAFDRKEKISILIRIIANLI